MKLERGKHWNPRWCNRKVCPVRISESGGAFWCSSIFRPEIRVFVSFLLDQWMWAAQRNWVSWGKADRNFQRGIWLSAANAECLSPKGEFGWYVKVSTTLLYSTITL
jgi:hypothetical protein